MIIQKLHDNWILQILGQEQKFNAKVPGSVYNDLLENKQIENPYWRDNEDKALKIMDNNFIYSSKFTLNSDIKNSEKILLRFNGLDTICDIFINDKKIGCAYNQHRVWEFDVKKFLKDEENEIKIIFYSPTKYIKQKQKEIAVGGPHHAMVGFPHIRKAHCMFGWDWGARLPDAGIWRDVELLGIDKARINSVYITQKHNKDSVDLDFDLKIDKICEKYNLEYNVLITTPDNELKLYENSPKKITIFNPQLWWPNGYGKQPLYKVKIQLKFNDTLIDVWEKRIGLRTMKISTEKDKYGESFAHQINGIKIFAMGADYIPQDSIFSRITKKRTRKLLQQCVQANFNCIRVWGGGYYPDDYFYDICDELGLIVWQDMMFACAVYELTDDFEKNITQELIDNIKRIRHHASLGLWCGNNEMEMFVDMGEWVNTPKQKCDYIKMYEYIFPKILKQYDPNTFYWPASPSSGGSFDNPNDENRGDVHYWDVWHGNKPFSEYRKFYFRYVSEFGFQSFPCEKTVESFTLPEDRNIFSYIMEKHQKNDDANGKIMNYIQQMYKYPTDFGVLLYASQMLQAEAIKYGVEHWRRNRGRCMGAIYWQLNDCWPVASWSSIDYYGRLKILHYYAKRFFSPLMLSCQEESTITQEPNVNAESLDIEKSIRLNVANETMEDKQVLVKWQLRKNDASIIEQGQQKLVVPKLSSVWLDKKCFPNANLYTDYISYQLEENYKNISSGTVLFCAPKHFEFLEPNISVKVHNDKLIVSAKGYAKGIEILNENQDIILEDNYFDLSNETREIKVISGDISNLKVRSVIDIK